MDAKWFDDGRLGVAVGDITQQQVDAVVNAANSSLLGGGGVDGAIHSRGGSSILEECKRIREERYPEGLPTGKAVVTSAGNLPCSHVIHTVGPVWQNGKSGEEDLLASAYRESLLKAEEIGAGSVVFPAISTGIYGYPKERAARTAYKTISSFLRQHPAPEKVVCLFFSERDAVAFLKANRLD
jgi:O-acetyl-ADP-ribose deacetylase (regulator of RNase III)